MELSTIHGASKHGTMQDPKFHGGNRLKIETKKSPN
jgi:hypothetical protein